jgi:hypothetical protein
VVAAEGSQTYPGDHPIVDGRMSAIAVNAIN